MASSKTRIKPIRIANETADYFEGKPLNRIVESIHRLMESGKVVLDEDEIKIIGDAGVYTEKSKKSSNISQETEKAIAEIDEMALCLGLSLEELTGQFCGMLNDGVLTVEGGVLMAEKDSWAADFEETCHDLCIPVEKAAASAVKALRKGQI